MDFRHASSYFSPFAMLYNTYYRNWRTPLSDITGKTRRDNEQASYQAQIDYEQYLKRGNERALADFYKNEPGHTIKYPEFSYPGQIYRADTASARAGFSYSTADANYYGNLPYRFAGLYGISSKLSRTM